MGSFQETASRKTTENTVKHCNCGVGSVVANHHGGGESSLVVTTLKITDRSFLPASPSLESTPFISSSTSLIPVPLFQTNDVTIIENNIEISIFRKIQRNRYRDFCEQEYSNTLTP